MISVIVPVYNSEKYLHICLNSILKQTYEDFEVICIDNNSTDSSGEILKYFSKKDSRVKIIENKYQKDIGYCLNKGLEIAKGKYITFLNSKDWLSLNSFELFIEKIETDLSEAVIFRNIFYNENLKEFSIQNENIFLNKFENKTFNHNDLPKNSLFEIPLNSYNCFYSKSFLEKLNIKWLYGNKTCIFNILLYKTFINAKRISLINKKLYNFREKSREEINSPNKIIEEINVKYNIFKIFLENKKIYDDYEKQLFDFCITSLFNKINKNNSSNILYNFQPILQELILKYGLYEDIKKNIDIKILNKLKFENLISDLDNNYPQISVIIPMFNAEQYINKCLNSICNQTFKNFEIICVNDGSNDETLNILNEFAKTDLRISIINQKRGGPGFARNVGIKNAKGKYILFVDSDDYIEQTTIEYSYNNIISNESDLAIFKFARFTEEEKNYSQTGFPLDNLFGEINFNAFSFTYKDIKKYVLNASFSTWSKIYKKEFLDSFESNFPVGIVYEDVLFHIKALLNATSISFIPKFLYNYRTSNPTSIMNDKSNIWDIFEACNYVEEYLKNNNYFNEFRLEFLTFKITQLSQYIEKINSEKYFTIVKNEFERLFNEKEYLVGDFNSLPDAQKTKFYSILNSENYQKYLNNKN